MFKEEAGFASSRECYRYTPRSKNKRKSYRRVILNEGVEIEEEGGSRPKNRSNLQCEPSPLLLPQRGIRQIFSICHGSIKSILRNDVGNGRYRVTLLISLLRRDRHRSGRGQFKRRAGRSPKNTRNDFPTRPRRFECGAIFLCRCQPRDNRGGGGKKNKKDGILSPAKTIRSRDKRGAEDAREEE